MGFVSRIFCLLIGYICGCVLTADLVSQRMANKRVFDLGDGNPGMANVGHCLGIKAAAYTLVGDLGKVIVATLIATLVCPSLGSSAAAWAGLGATLGHNYPFWHSFKGGKGVATTCAAIVLTSPVWGGLSCILGFVTVIVSEYLCVGAVAIPAFFVLFMLLFGTPELTVVALLLLLLMLPQHTPAIREIRSGRTPKAGIAKTVRDHFKGSKAQALDPGSTTAWPVRRSAEEWEGTSGDLQPKEEPQSNTGTSSAHVFMQRVRQTEHEWRNSSWLDRHLPVFEQDENNEWATPPASAFPSRPIIPATHETSSELKQTAGSDDGTTADSTVALPRFAAKKANSHEDDEQDDLGAAASFSATHDAKTDSAPVIEPGSTAPMVIPKASSPLDESNPLQRALIQAHKHQDERRREAEEKARQARAQAEAEEQERRSAHSSPLFGRFLQHTHRRSSGATSA